VPPFWWPSWSCCGTAARSPCRRRYSATS
jgi:hypothetical protein